MKSVHFKISGLVQGVFFRASARKKAEELGLKGWIKNTDDFVEGAVSGREADVDGFLQWAHSGPERARVDRVEVSELKDISFEGFQVIRGG